MFNVDESLDENNSSNQDPVMSNEPNENEIEHDPFEFSLNDEIPFSRFSSNLIVW